MTRRAIVFDLDDTLYRERRFALSGYRAVALAVERDFGLSGASAFKSLALSLRRGRRALAFQDLAASCGLPGSSVPAWIECYRNHVPQLRLLPEVRRTLDDLRRRWRVGVLTNGPTVVQAAKVAALGLDPLVDAVTYADQFGGGKPSPEAFLEILARLDADPGRTVFAGDDPHRDIAGARRVGMKTVYLDRGRGGPATTWAVGADAVVRTVGDVPAAAERLVGEERGHVH
jgi:putative hydrolase of the HAD superfamily